MPELKDLTYALQSVSVVLLSGNFLRNIFSTWKVPENDIVPRNLLVRSWKVLEFARQ